MTALDRKQKSEKLLLSLGITLADDLPPMDEENILAIRSAQEVAERILILTYLSCIATDPSLQQHVMTFLINEGLWDKASQEEKALFHKTPFSEDDLTVIMWRAESIWLLLWVIGKVDELHLPEKEVSLQDIFPNLPGFLEPTWEFINESTMRSVSEILDQNDFTFRLNWALQKTDALDSGTSMLNLHVTHERFLALDWMTGAREAW
jgi:hypothetical protein